MWFVGASVILSFLPDVPHSYEVRRDNGRSKICSCKRGPYTHRNTGEKDQASIICFDWYTAINSGSTMVAILDCPVVGQRAKEWPPTK